MVSYKRHIAKTITWRIIGTLDTMIISWIVTGSWKWGLAIGGIEVFTKMILYFLHERAWFKYGYVQDSEGKSGLSKKRHLFKTFTWRGIGTIDTMLLAWLITGDPITGLQIGGIEVVSKMILYYLHERVWYKFDFGIERDN